MSTVTRPHPRRRRHYAVGDAPASTIADLVREVIAGTVPAEALPPREREDLMCAWVDAGWSDVEIAAHTCWSIYTVARIRTRLGLDANPDPARTPVRAARAA